MLNISNFQISNYINTGNNIISPSHKVRIKAPLTCDVVSFSSNYDNDNVTSVQRCKLKEYLESISGKEKWKDTRFTKEEVNKIISEVDKYNFKYVRPIVNLYDGALKCDNITNILLYISNKHTEIDKINQKLQKISNLEHITKNEGYRQSAYFPDFIKKLSPETIESLIYSDVLLEHNNPNNVNSFCNTFNIITTYMDSKAKKYTNDYNNKIIEKNVLDSNNNALKRFVQQNFADLIQTGYLFSDKVFNEFMNNRRRAWSQVYIDRMNILTPEDKILLQKIQKRGVMEIEDEGAFSKTFPLSLDDKINALNLIACNRHLKNCSIPKTLNFKDYFPKAFEDSEDNINIDFTKIKRDMFEPVLLYNGLSEEDVEKYMQKLKTNLEQGHYDRQNTWDMNYVHLLAPLIPNPELKALVRNTTLGNFNNFIFRSNNEYARKNAITANEFCKYNLNYKEWQNPSIAAITREYAEKKDKNKIKKFTVKMWERIPQESLFDGNYTTCCTGLDKDHGDSFIKYMLYSAINTIEVRSEKGKVVGMSRLLMADVDNKPAIIIENIEANNNVVKHYLYNDEAKYKFREAIFDYTRELAKKLNNNSDVKIPIYFSSKYFKIRDIEKGLNKSQVLEPKLIGGYPDKLYINSYGGKYIKNAIHDDGDELSLKVIDVTDKTPLKNEVFDDEHPYLYNVA